MMLSCFNVGVTDYLHQQKFSSTEQTADEAWIAQNFLLLLLLTTKVSERVDDDAKDEVEYNDDNDEEENQIVDNTCKE